MAREIRYPHLSIFAWMKSGDVRHTTGYDPVRITKPISSTRSESKAVVENEVFGNNAAIGCHLQIMPFQQVRAVWDPGAKRLQEADSFRDWSSLTRSLFSWLQPAISPSATKSSSLVWGYAK